MIKINNNKLPFSHKKKHDLGFSLLEVLVSTAVLAMVLVGLAMLLSYTVKSSDQARVRTFAADLAQSRIDIFRHQRSIFGWSGLSQALETRKYCINNISESTTEINFELLPNEDSCTFQPVSDDIPALFRQVVDVAVDTGAGEIKIETIISWQNDQGNIVDARSSFVLRKDSRETSVFVPMVPSATDVPPSPMPTVDPCSGQCIGLPQPVCAWPLQCNMGPSGCEWQCYLVE